MSLANEATRFLTADEQAGGPQPGSPRRAATPSMAGRRVGAYLITGRLGAGGVGEVFKGVDVMLKREVALKILRDELASDPVFLERFRQEARLHAKLSHPNVASVYAFLQEGNQQFLVMEYVEGITLHEFIHAGGPLPVKRALGIFRLALDGIAHAHNCGIVHRDIKPANIMLADNGQVKVMDFGIARALDSCDRLTRLGQVAGTAKSMSPEQIRGGQADFRSDIYSLGIVLYTLLAGRPPFEGESAFALMKSQLETAPPPLRVLPAAVEAVVMRALEKDPSARYQTIAEFSRAIDASLADIGTETTAAPVRHEEPLPNTVLNPALRDDIAWAATALNPILQKSRETQAPQAMSRPEAAPPIWRRQDLRVGALALAASVTVAGAFALWPLHPKGDTETTASARRTVSVHPASVQFQTAAAISPPPAPPRPTLAITIVSPDPTDGEHRFEPGEPVRLLVAPSQDAHVYCYLQDETRSILRFYPNRFNHSALVRASAPLEIPGPMRFELVANTRRVTETIACFASARDVMAKLPTAVVGTDFTRLAATSLDQVSSAFAQLGDDALASARFELTFR